MAKILDKQKIAENIYRLKIEAPEISKKRKPGQFIIFRIDEDGERIPLTIADSDSKAGTIDLIIQAVGKSTTQLVEMNVGDDILDLVGPLGVPTKIEKLPGLRWYLGRPQPSVCTRLLILLGST